MRVAIIACPAWANWAPNPAMLLLAAQVRRAGHEVACWDLNIDLYRAVEEPYRSWWLDENSTKWETDADVDRLWAAHGDFLNRYADGIAARRPEAVAFTVNVGARCMSPRLARAIRQKLPGVPIIFGGSDCFRSEHFTRHMVPGVVDALCMGEGDFVLPELLDAVAREGRVPVDQPGFCTWDGDRIRDNGDPRRPEDLDVLAPIDLTGVDLAKYVLDNRVTMSISRGCVKRCAFCSEGPNFFLFRSHSAEWMVDQLSQLLPDIEAACGKTPHINFNDSLINGNMDVLGGMCDAILAKGLRFTWGGMAIIRKEMSRSFLEKMRRAGCVEICWGIESGSTRVLKRMGKGVTVSLMDQVVRTAAKAGIQQYGNIIIGFPGEGPREFAESMLFAVKNAAYFNCLGLPIFTPRQNSTVFKSPHLYGMANLEPNAWATMDETNTPAVRVLRRQILARILAEKKFDQGRHSALEAEFPLDLSSPELQREYREIFDHYIDLTMRFLGADRDRLPLLLDNVDDAEIRSRNFVRGRIEEIDGAAPDAPVPESAPAPRVDDEGQWMTVGGGRSRAGGVAAATAESNGGGGAVVPLDPRKRLLKRKLANIEKFRGVLRDIRAGTSVLAVPNTPIELYAELTKRCNLDCPMCSNKMQLRDQIDAHGRDSVDFPTGLLAVYDPFLETAAMAYTVGIGEPTLYPHLASFVARCTSKGVFVWTNTNAVAIREELIDKLLDAGLSRLCISCSGGTKETFERFHRPAKWERLWRTVESLQRAKNARGVASPALFFNYVVMEDNLREVPAFVGRLGAFDVQGMSVKPVVNMRGVLDLRRDAPGRYAPAPGDRDALARAGALARDLGINWEAHSFTEEHRAADKAEGVCLHPFSTLYVNALGDVYPCGPGETLVGADLRVGNANERPIEEIWNGEAMQALRARMLRRDYPDGCRECIAKQLCRLSNDIHDNVAGLESAAREGCANLGPISPDLAELPASPATAPADPETIRIETRAVATAREGELIPIERLGFQPPKASKPAAAVESPVREIDWPAAPPQGLLGRIKERNYARYQLSQIEGSDVALNTPLEIFLASADACNLSCRFCAITVKDPRPVGSTAIMKPDVMRAVAPWLPGASNMSLTGFGEPFMNPNLLGTVAAGIDHGSRIEFFTNGKMLTAERARRVVEAGLPNLFVSISSADPTTYERLYVDGDFERLRTNLAFLRDEKARRGTALPRVIFNTIVMRSTLAGLPDLVRFAAEMGVGKIDLKPLVTYEAIPALHEERIHYEPERDDAILAEVRSLATEAGIEIGEVSYTSTRETEAVESPRPSTGRDWEEPKLQLRKPCPLVWRTMYVGVRGDVKPCCFAADDKGLSLGNIREETIHDVWNGERYRELRRKHLAGEVPEICAHCVKFQLQPKSDDAHLWLGERGIPVYSYAKIERWIDEARSQHELLLQAIATWTRAGRAERDAATLVDAYKRAVALLKALSSLEAEIKSAKERLQGLDGIVDALHALLEALTAASLRWGEAVKSGEAAGVEAVLQEAVLPAVARWRTLAGRIRRAFADAYGLLARRVWGPADVTEMRESEAATYEPRTVATVRRRFEAPKLRAALEGANAKLLEEVVAAIERWSGADPIDAEGFRPVLGPLAEAQRHVAHAREQLEAAGRGRPACAELAPRFAALHRQLTQACFELTSATNAGDVDALAEALSRTLLAHLADWPELERSAWETLEDPSAPVVVAVEQGAAPEPRNERDAFRSPFGGLWVDRNDFAERLEGLRDRGVCTEAEADALRRFRRDGYIILPQAVDEATIDAINGRIETLWRRGHPELKLDILGDYHSMSPEWRQKRAKLLDIYVHDEAARRALFAPRIQRFFELIFERDLLLFQSLSFEYGTEQSIHQDTAYVVVNSPMELAAVWIALEDIRPGTGELEYYVGSHRLPDHLYGGGRKHWDPSRDGPAPHDAHLEALHRMSAERGLKRERFMPRKGDVLVWAADLAHGGSKIERPGLTRRSLVGHYCPVGVAPHYYGYLPDHRVRALYRPGCWYSSSHYRLADRSDDRSAAVGA